MARTTRKSREQRKAERQLDLKTALVKRGKGHGGRREGAGRKPGPQTIAKRQLGIREVTDGIIREGYLPLRVMVGNMKHYMEEGLALEVKMQSALAEYAAMIVGDRKTKREERKRQLDQVERIVELFARASDNRMKGQKCASDAAPYLHPRLSNVDVNVNRGSVHPRDVKVDPNDEEQLVDNYLQLRSMPYEVPLATDEQGAPVEAELLPPEPEQETEDAQAS